jgi:uncharacterized protein
MSFEELHRLIKNGDLVSLRQQLDEGSSTNTSNRHSWNLLMLAALEGNTSIGDLLISRGAPINSMNDLGETPLSLAAHKGHAPFVQLLLSHGASKDCRPHGHSLEDWLRVSSGLRQDKIALILDLIRRA